MPYVNGKWEVEDASVAPRVQGLMAQNNPLMKQARSQGMATGNRRGLLNSSMAAGAAQGEAYKVATPIAMQEASQVQQANMAEMDRTSQIERQNKDIAAQMERLTAQAGFQREQIAQQGGIQSGLQREQFGYQTQLTSQQSAAEMARLERQLAGADAQQTREIEAQMARLRESGGQQERMAERQFGYQTQLFSQQAQAEMQRLQASSAAEMARLERQLAGADAQQQREIQAQMQRLQTQNEAEMTRLREQGAQQQGLAAQQFGFQTQLNAQVAGTERERQILAGSIQERLQTQANDQQLQRMGAEFAQQLQVQSNDQQNALARLTASGDQEMRQLASAQAAELQRLQLNLQSSDRQQVAQSMATIFGIEANMRAALLGNTNMPAQERAAYERAISTMGQPARDFVSQLYGNTGAAAGPGAIIGGGGLAAGLPSYTPSAPVVPAGTIAPGAQENVKQDAINKVIPMIGPKRSAELDKWSQANPNATPDQIIAKVRSLAHADEKAALDRALQDGLAGLNAGGALQSNPQAPTTAAPAPASGTQSRSSLFARALRNRAAGR